MKIPITKALFSTDEMKAVQIPLKTGWLVQGPFVKKFEKKFSAYINIESAVATSSCTTALHIAAAALKLKPGQEVIVPSFTWIATANAVEYMGAKPIFCDIDLKTFNIDVKKIESLITRKTVGIIPVHLFGLCADMNPILKIAKKYKLWIIEDAACAFGAQYHGRHAGTFGDLGCFSFHPRKSITTGEGGMITTDQDDLEKRCRSLRDHGAERSHSAEQNSSFLLPEYKMLGYNFRMTDIQGALGSVQMDRAAKIIKKRIICAKHYDRLLRKIPELRTPYLPPKLVHSYQAYVSLFCPEKPTIKNVGKWHKKRNTVMALLEKKGIATRQGTHAVVLQSFYKKKYSLNPNHFPNSVIADKLSLALPLYPTLKKEEQNFIVQELQNAFRKVLHD